MKIHVSVRSPKLALLAAQLSEAKRTDLNEAMGISVRELTRRHLGTLSNERKNKLGGTSTGYFAQAARAVEHAPVDANVLGATFTINHVGLGRAFHDVTIVPKAAKALTIPVCALAYGRRAREFGNQLYIFRSKTTGNAFLAMRDPTGDKSARPLLMYLLVSKVTQKQDRSLLPSAEEWERAAARGAIEFLRFQTGALS